MLRRMLLTLQVAGEAVKEAPSWAGPDVIIAATLKKLDQIVAAASAEVCAFCMLLILHDEPAMQDAVCFPTAGRTTMNGLWATPFVCICNLS